MALNASACAAELNSNYINFLKVQNYSYIDVLNTVVDKYSQMAVPIMTNVDIKPIAGSLNITIVDAYQETLEIATKYMTYWSKAITPTGIPINDSIISVVNDAMSYVSSLKAALDNSARGIREGVCYKEFCEILFNHAKMVKWTVTEMNKVTTVTYVVTVT